MLREAMNRPGPRLLVLLSLATGALPIAGASPQSVGPGPLSSCSSCWPLSGAHPGSVMAADGAGGMYIVWVDGSARWRLQRLRSDLTIPPPWPADGIALQAERRSRRFHPVLAADGGGGVYVAWTEQSDDGDMSAWLLRVRSDGRPSGSWPDSGIRVSGVTPALLYPALARGSRGATVAWMEARDSSSWIRISAFDGRGRLLRGWPAEGLVVGRSMRPGDAIGFASDGEEGGFVTWTEMRDRLSDVKMSYVSRPGGAGRNWTVVSEAVPPDATLIDKHPELVADGRGGAIAVWTDERNEAKKALALMDVFAQHVASSGVEGWAASGQGRAIAAGPGYQLDPHVVSDGMGGAYFAWDEQGPGATDEGRMVHLDAEGRPAPGWPESGISLGLEVSNLFSDLDGGAFVTWVDSSAAYLQRFESRWNPGFAQPAAFSLGPPAGRRLVRVAADGRGGAFLAWEEQIEGKTEIQVQHVSLGGWVAKGPLPPAGDGPPAIAFAVHAIFPNPARTQCRITFDLPRQTRVSIDVFDVTGRLVARLADGRGFEAGRQSLPWDLIDRQGRRVPAGIYLVRVDAGRDRAVGRMVVTP
jgi:type IX secretion system substrate protein